MIILNQENQGILDLFNLENTDVMSLECENVNNTMNITVVLNPDYLPCPDCGYDQPVILQYVKKRIRHSILEDRACYLIYMARRYRCPEELTMSSTRLYSKTRRFLPRQYSIFWRSLRKIRPHLLLLPDTSMYHPLLLHISLTPM